MRCSRLRTCARNPKSVATACCLVSRRSTLGWNPWATVVFRVPRPLAWLFVAAAMFATPDEGLAQMPDLSGNWIRGGRLEFGEWSLTDEGRRGLEAYDFKTDDPAYRCLAASWARAWMNPNVVVRITQSAKEVRFQHEFMDIDRRLPIVEAAQANPPRVSIQGQPALGSSTAWYDGDSLVIETTDVGPGYVSTMQEWAGLPQSRRMRTVERLRRSGDLLTIELTHDDPAYYRKPLVVTLEYKKTDFELMKYDCSPEEASIVAPR